ncbi:hypothetical protein [Nocardia terpenica]|uniref:hypothetical protein n=1 Tax=Nocardia terpenica TaxID=455432 RepID=UPI0012E8FD49|nr:hypothetical protein [Nocardia terpenica]NQE90899.1 hypothetical protein [Nocardia terpenica]
MSPYDEAIRKLRQLVFDTLRRRDGESAVVLRQVDGWGNLSVEVPVDPLAAAAVSKSLMSQLQRLAGEYARHGREEGRSWSEVARALHLDGEPYPGEAAFNYIAGGSSHPHSHPFTSWTCRTCGCRIVDFGPQCGPHPDDREVGHTPSCARHNEEIRTYRQQLDCN